MAPRFRVLPCACLLLTALVLGACDSGSNSVASPSVPSLNRASPVMDAKGFRLLGQFADPVDTVQFNVMRFAHLEAEGNRTVALMASWDLRLNRYRWVLQSWDGNTPQALQTRDEANPQGYQYRYDFSANALYTYSNATAYRVSYFTSAGPAPQYVPPPFSGAPLELGTRYSTFQDRTDQARRYFFDHQRVGYASPGPSSSTNLTPETSVVKVSAWIGDQTADSVAKYIRTGYLAYVTNSNDSGTELKVAQGFRIVAKKRIFPDTTFSPAHTVTQVHASRTGDRIDLGLGWWGPSGMGMRLALYRFQVPTNTIETVYDSVAAPSDTIDAFFGGTFHFGLKRVGPTGALQEFAAPVLAPQTRQRIVHTPKAVFLCIQKEDSFLELYRQDLQ
jgi:hypothetical protein